MDEEARRAGSPRIYPRASGGQGTEVDVPGTHGDDLLDRIVDLGLRHRVSWAQVQRLTRAVETGSEADVVVALFGALFTEAQLETLPQALAAGAKPWELLELGVHGRNCEGEDLPLLSGDALRQRMEAAAEFGQGQPSAWLLEYAGRLAAEARRRRGGGASS